MLMDRYFKALPRQSKWGYVYKAVYQNPPTENAQVLALKKWNGTHEATVTAWQQWADFILLG